MQPATKRLFFAFELTTQLQEQLMAVIATLKKQNAHSGIKWTSAEKLHMTLRFLGSTRTDMIPACLDLMAPKLKQIPAFSVNLSSLVTLPQRYPRLLALAAPLTLELAELFNMVEHMLAALAFAPEKRPFFPHVTLGRSHGRKFSLLSLLQDYSLPTFLPLQITHLCLYASEPTPAGSIYTILERMPLL